MVYVNGRFLAQRVTGIQRYAREVLGELDALLAEGHEAGRLGWTLVAPRGAPFPPLRHIRAEHHGRLRGHGWEQLELPVIARGGFLVSFGTTGPCFVRSQLITVHDASVYRVPESFSWRFRAWYRLNVGTVVRRAPRTMVVSEFAAREAVRHFGARADRLAVMGEGWQHLLRVEADDSVLRAHALTVGSYVLAVGSPTPNKNFALVRAAMGLLGDVPLRLVVVGAADPKVFAAASPGAAARTTEVGYVSDAQLKTLYAGARLFVFPSRYEGFGIPPLEAMAMGCPVVASDIESVREVCGDAARYFDPSDAPALATLLRELWSNDAEVARMRERGIERAALYSWKEAARRALAAVSTCVTGSDGAAG